MAPSSRLTLDSGADTRLDATAPALPSTERSSLPDHLFHGPWQRLVRPARVAPGTVVLVHRPAAEPQLRHPGDLLLPSWPLTPARRVLVISTGTVRIPVRLDHLTTLDHEDLHHVELDVDVRLVDSEIAGLFSDVDTDVGARFTEEVESAVEASVRAAVGLNRAEDIRRQSLAQLLENRWLPTSFSRNAVVRTGFTVRTVAWSAPEEQEDPTPTLPEGLPPSSAHDSTPVDTTPLVSPAIDSAPVEARPGELVSDNLALVGAASTGSAPARTATDAPALGLADVGIGGRQRRTDAAAALQLVYVPAVITVAVAWLFFVMHWLPELRGLPGMSVVLEQLAPLASKELTSQGQAVVASQADHSGVSAAYLLLVSLLFAPLARARHWLSRLVLAPLAYFGAIGALVTVFGLVVRGRLAESLLGVVLLGIWVYAAGVTVWRCLWVDVEQLPRRPDRVWWLVVAFALLSPAPVALGRAIFAPELRTAALSLAGNDLSLRWAALLTPTTAPVYGCGVLLAVVYWAVYVCWPPRRSVSLVRPLVVLGLALLTLALLGAEAGRAAEGRAELIRTQSPRDELGFTCGDWVQQPAGAPARTLIVSGLSCRRVTTFSGYRETGSSEAPDSLSPVNATTVGGRPLPGELVGAEYGDVVVLAGSGRVDNRATEVIGLRMSDAVQLWRFTCLRGDTLVVRFARSSTGDDPAAGRVTVGGEPASVAVSCGAGASRLDPRTGRRL